MIRHYTCADTRQPSRQAEPDAPPQEGNGPALTCADTRQPSRQAEPDASPQEGNDPTNLCRSEATTPPGGA